MDFKLRKWEKSDVAFLVKYANNWEIARKLTDQFPYHILKMMPESF